MMNILKIIWKFILVIPSVSAGIVGIIQALIKFAKEVCTLALNILVPIFPQMQTVVLKLRDIINKIDNIFQKLKSVLLKIAGIQDGIDKKNS